MTPPEDLEPSPASGRTSNQSEGRAAGASGAHGEPEAVAVDGLVPPEPESGSVPGAGDAAAGTADAELDGADEASLPDDASRLTSIVESLLFAADRPLTVPDLKRLLGDHDGQRITSALDSLREARAGTGVQLVAVAGAWQLRTHPQNGNWVAKLVAGRPQRLSRAMMETLAIVAYRQPITRPEVDEIRGVDCGPVLRTLLERGLVRAIGKKEEVGRPILYGTTADFLKTFSMRDLTELPTLREFHELGAEERAKVGASIHPSDARGVAPDSPGGAGVLPPGEGSEPGGALADGTRPRIFDAPDLPTYDASEEDALIDALEAATHKASVAVRSRVDADVDAEDETRGGPDENGPPESETEGHEPRPRSRPPQRN